MKLNLASVYALIDPRTYQIRYVGQTIQELKQRLAEHVSLAKRNKVKNQHVYNWISQLLRRDLEPRIVLLEKTTNELVTDREKYWINHLLKNGNALTNKNLDPHEVHNKGIPHKPETIRKLRLAKKKQDAVCPPFKGRKHSEKTKKIMSEKKKGISGKEHPMYGRKHTEEAKRRMSLSKKGKPWSDSRRLAQRARVA